MSLSVWLVCQIHHSVEWSSHVSVFSYDGPSPGEIIIVLHTAYEFILKTSPEHMILFNIHMHWKLIVTNYDTIIYKQKTLISSVIWHQGIRTSLSKILCKKTNVWLISSPTKDNKYYPLLSDCRYMRRKYLGTHKRFLKIQRKYIWKLTFDHTTFQGTM